MTLFYPLVVFLWLESVQDVIFVWIEFAAFLLCPKRNLGVFFISSGLKISICAYCLISLEGYNCQTI